MYWAMPNKNKNKINKKSEINVDFLKKRFSEDCGGDGTFILAQLFFLSFSSIGKHYKPMG